MGAPTETGAGNTLQAPGSIASGGTWRTQAGLQLGRSLNRHGGDASRVFTLVYDLNDVDRLYQRFPGVEGTAYFIAGLGVNYQRADGITLAPIRSGVGFRAGANVGYLAYSRQRNWLPF